ncbi:hypothetical protein [Anaeromyxobacter oryzae]|nr:hypothetical protein [Anaeromyxobacter oryzae]
MPGQPRASGPTLAALAGAIHLGFDALATRLPATTPPYLLLDHAGEMFRGLVEALDRTAVIITVSVMAAAVNGIIAALLAVAFEGLPHRRRALAWTLLGLWTLGGALMMAIYLAPPWGIALGSLAAGIPRVLLVAWALDRVMPPAKSELPDSRAA